jgi:hypothetical protein
MFVRKERGRNTREARRLRVPFQTREAMAFPHIALSPLLPGMPLRRAAVETLHLL